MPPQPPVCRIFFAPTAPQSVQSATFWHSQELATTHADKVRTGRLRHQPAWALWHSNCHTNAPRVQTGRRTGAWTTHRRKGALRMRHDRLRSAPFRRPVRAQRTPMRLRSSHHVPHALGERRGLRRAARLAFTPHMPHARRRASPSRFAPRTSTPAPPHAPNCDAHSMRPIISNGVFRHFRTPKIWVGVGPSPGFAVLPFALVGQAKTAVATKKAAEVAAPVRSPHWMCVGSPSHCERHVLMCSSATTFHT